MEAYPFGSICSVWLGHSFHSLLHAPTILPLARSFPRLLQHGSLCVFGSNPLSGIPPAPLNGVVHHVSPGLVVTD
jgi:hypothetical protein